MAELVSRHFLRRTARLKERRLERRHPGNQYRVERYYGRLFKWAVYRVSKTHGAHVTGSR
jgi:hypothetical protein